MKFNMKSLLKNKYVLYIVFFFAITNFFGYVLLKNYDAVIFMVLVGLVTSYFSKNMIVILVTSIASTTLLTAMSTVNEAMTTTKAPTTTVPEKKKKKKKKNKKKHNISRDHNRMSSDSDSDSDSDDSYEDSDGSSDSDDSYDDSYGSSDSATKDGNGGEGFKLRDSFSKNKKKNKNKKLKALELSSEMGLKSMNALEPLMKQAEGMLNILDKTNAIQRMEGLVSKIDKLR